jgi:predicted nucleotidyltransferase
MMKSIRLSDHYIKTIKSKFEEFFVNGEIYLFGSRVHANKKGGDIDLYLVLDDHTNLFEKKLKFLSRIKRVLGEQKIDIVFNTDKNRLIEQEAMRWGVKL